MQPVSKLIFIILLSLSYIATSSAGSPASYKDDRDQMMKMRAAASKKKPVFTPAERQLMKDAMMQTKKKYPHPGLKKGETAPDFTLINAFGKPVNLYNQLKKGPVVLVFYRGAWCPFCNLHLHVLKKSLPELKKYKAQLVTVTPQRPDKSLGQIKKDAYPFEILSDLNDKVMKQYRLYYELSPELDRLYKKKGLDVEKFNGKGRTALPVPGTFIIGTDKVIKAVHAQHDYKERMEPADIIKVLMNL